MAVNDVSLAASMRSNLLLLQNTQDKINTIQNRLATGNKVNSALDGPNEFFASKGLNQRASDLSSLKDAMGQAISTIKAGDTGITSIEKMVDQMRGITTSAFGALGDDDASIATRKTLAEQFNTLKDQIDQLASDSGYAGKNLLTGNGLTIDSTSSSRADVNSITGISNARTTNVVSADTYSVRVAGDGALTGNATDITTAERERALVGLKVSGTISSTLGSFQDISVQTAGSAGQLRTFTVSDGNEARVVKYFDDTQDAETALTTTARSGVAQVSQVTITGTIEGNDVFSVTIEGVTFEYTANFDSDAANFTDDDAAAVATALGACIQAAISSQRLSGTKVTSVSAANGVITVNGTASASSANSFTISSTTTNAKSVQISQSFASGSVVSFTVDRVQMEGLANSGNGESRIEKNVNIQISVSSLSGDVVTRDGMNQSGDAKLADGENSFAFDSGTVRLTVDDGTIRQAASASAAANLITVQQSSANTQNDITVSFNERGTNNVTVESQNVQTSGQGLRIDYAQNNFRDRSDIENAVAGLDYAKTQLRSASQSLSTNLNIITTREGFTKEFSDVLVEGANKLTLADQNEEGTKLLMLQTRQQLGTISLSLANQQQQAILRLF